MSDRCPLCSGPNDCAMAAGARTAATCWCTSTRVPPTLRAMIPDDARDVACVCVHCVERHQKNDDAPAC